MEGFGSGGIMELLFFLFFISVLVFSVVRDISIVYALLVGYCIFFAYGLLKGRRAADLFRVSLEGVRKIGNILIVFIMIGMITGMWRASGTIAVIISYSVGLLTPALFLLFTFLLNIMVSVLTGTSFGTIATMGIICMTMARAMDMNIMTVAGAVMSGAYFGDRCSPVSTSALLVSEVTGTNLYGNIKNMLRSCAVPLLISCVIYFIMGLHNNYERIDAGIRDLFSEGFALHWIAVIPAAAVLILAILHVEIKKTLSVSILLAAFIALLLQGCDIRELIYTAVFGFHSRNPELASMIDGGGAWSMLKVSLVVLVSSTYAGLFRETGMLDGIQRYVERLAGKVTAFGSLLIVAIVTCCIACNQTLAVMLTHQLAGNVMNSREKEALAIENTVIVIAPLTPWSIASAMPLAMLGAPTASLLSACFLYLVPIWDLLLALWQERKLRKLV